MLFENALVSVELSTESFSSLIHSKMYLRRNFGRRTMKNRFEPAFTLIETLLVLLVVAVIAAGVTLGVNQAIKDGKGRECAVNLATIEGAKDEFARDNPGVGLTSVDQLKPYLRYGLPTCPAGGTYDHVLDLNQRCTCSLGIDSKPGSHSLAQP